MGKQKQREWKDTMGDSADSLEYPVRGYFPMQANDSRHPLTRYWIKTLIMKAPTGIYEKTDFWKR